MIILDTDIVSLVQRRDSAARELLLSRIDREIQFQEVVTSIITYEEQVRGWFHALSVARTLNKKIAAICLARRAVLWTRNLQDFSQVPGLTALDPTA